MRRWSDVVQRLLVATVVAACGGGGGGGASSQDVAVPALERSAEYDLPTLPEVPSRTAIVGQERGRVVRADGAPVTGVTVELLDLTAGLAVLASGTTDAAGAFELDTAGLGGRPAQSLQLRAQLADGVVMRALPTGWTEVYPGSDWLASEVQRLRIGGAYLGRSMTVGEIQPVQDALTLMARARHADQAPAAAAAALGESLRYDQVWNDSLRGLEGPTTGIRPDVANLVPLTWLGAVVQVSEPAATEAVMQLLCSPEVEQTQTCGLDATDQAVLGETLVFVPGGVRLAPPPRLMRLFSAPEAEWNRLPMLEYPFQVGRQVVLDDQYAGRNGSLGYAWRARVTRHVYPPEMQSVLGTDMPVVRVVFDYELASATADAPVNEVLARETRWFAPGAGLVGVDSLIRQRQGGPVTTRRVSWRATQSVVLPGATGAVVPMAGYLDAQRRTLTHRHAVASVVRDRVFVAVDEGAQILELDAATLQTLRALSLPALARRLAISADGTRLYAGVDDVGLMEIDPSTLTIVRTTPLPAPIRANTSVNAISQLEVDPFDPGRVAAALDNRSSFGQGVLGIHSNGLWTQPLGAARFTSAEWDNFGLDAIMWLDAMNELLVTGVGRPESLYRLRVDGDVLTELAGRARLGDTGRRQSGSLIVTRDARLLDAITLATQRELRPDVFVPTACVPWDADSVTCRIPTATNDVHVMRLSIATGALLGTYRLGSNPAEIACGASTQVDGMGDFHAVPFGLRRALSSSAADGQGRYCSLQVWRLRGV